MIPAVQSAALVSLAIPPPLTLDYTFTPPGTANQTVTPPVGAVGVEIVAVCPGEGGSEDEALYYSGDGGGYSKRDKISLSGISALYIGFSSFTEVRSNNSGGTVLCKATLGSTNTASGTGDVKTNGGSGDANSDNSPYGGGAGGPSGNGGDGSTGGPGASGGAPGGAGTSADYGGGAYGIGGVPGGRGLARLTYYFE